MIYLVVAIFGILQYFNSHYLRIGYKTFNPLSTIIYVWTIVIVIHRYCFGIHNYSNLTYILISAGIIFLAIGFWMFARKQIVFLPRINIKKQSKVELNEYNLNTLSRYMSTFTKIEIIRVIYNVVYIVYGIAGSWSNFYSNNTYVRFQYLARNPHILENIFSFLCNASAIIGHVFLGICLAKKTYNARKYLIIWSIAELIFAIVTMSKLCFIMYVIIFVITYLNNVGTVRKQKKIFFKLLPIICIVITTFLLFIGHQRNYMAQGTLSSVVGSKVIDYLVGPTEALVNLVSLRGGNLSWGTSTFEFLTGMFQNFGIINKQVAEAQTSFIDIGGFETNVFTWFRPFYFDFSYIGFIIFPFFHGCIAGILYNQKTHNLFIDVSNACVSAVFAMSFFDYMWSQTIYIFIFIYAYILHRSLRNKLYVSTYAYSSRRDKNG